MTTALIPQTTEEAALLKAVGLDRVPPEQRALALNIADRYGLDLMLKHVVLIDGRPMVTRDGLLHIAHRSGQFDGIEVTEPKLEGGYWHATATVYRKDMSRGFTYSGRYPAQGGNAKYAPEMATKTAESHAFRRAFDISAPTVDEQWDSEGDIPTVVRQPVPLAAKAAAARSRIESRAATGATETTDDVVDGTFTQPDTDDSVMAEGVRSTVTSSGTGRAPSEAGGEAPTVAPGRFTDQQLRTWLREHFVGLTIAQTYIREQWGDSATIASITDEQRAQTRDFLAVQK